MTKKLEAFSSTVWRHFRENLEAFSSTIGGLLIDENASKLSMKMPPNSSLKCLQIIDENASKLSMKMPQNCR